MRKSILDQDGDNITLSYLEEGGSSGLYLTVRQKDGDSGKVDLAGVGPIDPRDLIEAIEEECGLGKDEPEEDISDDSEGVDNIGTKYVTIEPVIDTEKWDEVLTDAARRTRALRTLDEEIDARAEQQQTFPLRKDERGAFKPATAEEPRLWAGADEPVIDGLIGRVADLEDEKEATEAHEHLSEHWERRLRVVEKSLTMIPAPGKRGGIMATFAGEQVTEPDRVEKALKIARFAADEDRDIPGVDK